MITCRKCNAQLQDDARFCNNCGAKVNETISCPACGRQVRAEYDFCLFCGSPLKAPTKQEASGSPEISYHQVPVMNQQTNISEPQMPVSNLEATTPEPQVPVSNLEATTPEPQVPVSSFQAVIPDQQVEISNQQTVAQEQQTPMLNPQSVEPQAPVNSAAQSIIPPIQNNQAAPVPNQYNPVTGVPMNNPNIPTPVNQNNPVIPAPVNQNSPITPASVNQSIPAQNYTAAIPQGKPAKQKKIKKEKPAKQGKIKKAKQTSDNTEQPVKGKRRKWMLLIPALLIVLAAGAFAAFLFLNRNSHLESVIYLKDGELKLTSQKSREPIELTKDFYDGDASERMFLYDTSSNINYCKNGNLLFYPDKITNGEKDLYYINLKSKVGEGEKIASKISRYAVNSSGTIIYYIKGEDTLYRSDLSDEEKIDSGVSNFFISEDGKKLVYQDSDNNIYYKDGDKDEIKIDSNSEFSYVSDTLDKIYYRKDNNLYLSTDGKDGEKLCSDATWVLYVYDTGEFYYLNTVDTEMPLSDFVNDDLLASDSALVEPVQPVYPYYEDCRPTMPEPVEPDYTDYYDEYYWVDWDAYYADLDIYTQEMNSYNAEWDRLYQAALEQYDKDYAAYEDAYEQYSSKAARDEIRNALSQNTITVTKSTLYYYDNEKTTVITDKFSDFSTVSNQKPGIVYQNLNTTELTKINMSEVTSYEDVNTYAQEAMNSSTEDYVAIGSVTAAIKQTNGRNYSFNTSDSALYFLNNYDEENGTGDLYEAKITDTTVGTPELYDKGVSEFQFYKYSDSIYYFKDRSEDYMADLYLNKKRIDFEVRLYNISVLESKDKDVFCYITDYDADTASGTLKLFNGTESVKISDDVYDYEALNEKYMVYLKDYKFDNSYGDLYQYSGSGKEKKIDKKVTLFIPRYAY